MKQIILYIGAYISLVVGWFIIFILILDIFEIIQLNMSDPSTLALIAVPLSFVYHKYKPMEIKEIIEKVKQKFNKRKNKD